MATEDIDANGADLEPGRTHRDPALPTLRRVTDAYQRDPALNASSAVAGTGAAK